MLRHLFGVLRSYNSLRRAPSGSREALAWTCMTSHLSYRLDQSAAEQPSIGFRVIWRSLRQMWSNAPSLKRWDGASGLGILDSDFRYEELEFEYVQRQAHEKPQFLISKTHLIHEFKGRFIAQGIWFIFALRTALHCAFFRKNRVQHALHPLFIAELTSLSLIVEREKVHSIYDFAPYLIDSNWVYLFLSDRLQCYSKLPSPGPLNTHNRITFCDQLIISSGYHEEELPLLADILYTRVQKWLPEWSFKYIDRYRDLQIQPPQHTIGFYSHGSWLRRLEQHSDDNLQIDKSEEQLLKDLNSFLSSHREFHLTIFLHPRERKFSDLEVVKAHYCQFLEPECFKFHEKAVPSTFAFEEVDIGLAAFSTILYERLFCGFKTLIGNYYTPDFPVQGSALSSLCFNDQDSLFSSLLDCSKESHEQYFENRGLMHYHYSTYPYFQEHDSNH